MKEFRKAVLIFVSDFVSEPVNKFMGSRKELHDDFVIRCQSIVILTDLFAFFPRSLFLACSNLRLSSFIHFLCQASQRVKETEPMPFRMTTSSTDSGQGSTPLSEVFMAVTARVGSRKGTSQRVLAPGFFADEC